MRTVQLILLGAAKTKQIRIKKINKRTQSKPRDKKNHPTPITMEVLIKNQNKNNGRLCDTKKKLEQGSIINERKNYSANK